MEVSQIMSEPVTIDKDRRLSDALDLLNKKGVDRLIVTDGTTIHGIITYADIADRLGVGKVVAVSIGRLHVSSAMTDIVITVAPNDDVTEVAQLMIDRGMSGCPVVDKNGALVGVVTKKELMTLIKKPTQVKVKNLMTTQTLLTVSPIERLVKARSDMLDAGYSGMPVVDGTRVLGILTEKMVAQAMAKFSVEVPDKYRDNQVRQLRVADAMAQQAPFVSPDDNIADVAKKMIDAGLNNLPVVGEGHRLIGIISATDMTRFVANKFKVPA